MKTYSEIQAEIQKLQHEAEIMKNKEISLVISDIKEKISLYNLTPKDIGLKEKNLGHKNFQVNKKIIPNVKGMGLRDALYLLENMELKVVVNGKGKVIDQSIPAGTLLTKNQTINLALN